MKNFSLLCVFLVNFLSITSAIGAPPVAVPVGSSEYKDLSLAFKKIWPYYSPSQGAQPADPLPVAKLPAATCGGLPVYVINFGEMKLAAATPKDAGGGWIGSGGPLKLIAGLDSKKKALTELYSDHFESLGEAAPSLSDCPDLAVNMKGATGMVAKTLSYDSTQKKYRLKGK